jgi:hypothetical protein
MRIPYSTSSMKRPSPPELDDLPTMDPLLPFRTVPPEEEQPGLVHLSGNPAHVPFPAAHHHPLSREQRPAVPFREKGRKPPGKEIPVRFRKAIENTDENLGAPEGLPGGQDSSAFTFSPTPITT